MKRIIGLLAVLFSMVSWGATPPYRITPYTTNFPYLPVVVTDYPFLADTNGVVDATGAFLAALATKVDVLVPKGTYRLGFSIALNTNQTLYLQNCTLNLGNNSIYLRRASAIIGLSPAQSAIVSTRTNGYVVGAPSGYGSLSYATLRNFSISGGGPTVGIFMDAWTSCTVENVEVDFCTGTNGLGYGFYGLGTTNGDCSENHFANLAANYNDHGVVFDADAAGAICGYNRIYGLRVQQGQRGLELLSSVIYGSLNNHFYDVFIQGRTSTTNNACAVLIEGDNNSIHDLNFDQITGTNLWFHPSGFGLGASGNYLNHVRNLDPAFYIDDSSAGPGNTVDTMNNLMWSPKKPYDFQNYDQRLLLDMSAGIAFQWRMPETIYMTNVAWTISMASNTSPNLEFINSINGHVLTLTQTDRIGIDIIEPRYTLDIEGWPSFPLALAMSESQFLHEATTVAPSNVFGMFNAVSQTDGGLQVKAMSLSQRAFILNAVQSATPQVGWPSIELIASRANGAGLQSLGSTSIVFSVKNYTEPTALTVMGDGYIGIGTTTPIAPLDLFHTGYMQFALHGGNGISNYIFAGTVANAAESYLAHNAFYHDTNYFMATNTYASGILFRENGDISLFANAGLTVGTPFAPKDNLHLNYLGNVGIGTNSPTQRLDIFKLSSPGIQLNENNTTKIVQWLHYGTEKWYDSLNSQYLMTLSTNGNFQVGGTLADTTPMFSVLSNGIVSVNLGPLQPETNIVSDLGTASLYWRTGYVGSIFSTNLHLSATGLYLGTNSGVLMATAGHVAVNGGVTNGVPYWTGAGAGQLGTTAEGATGYVLTGLTGNAPWWDTPRQRGSANLTNWSGVGTNTAAWLAAPNAFSNSNQFQSGVSIASAFVTNLTADTCTLTNPTCIMLNVTRTTSPAYLNALNTGGSFYVGKEGSAAANVMVGDVAYASVLNSAGLAPIMFGVNDQLVMTMATNRQITVTGNMGAVMSAGNTNVLDLNLATTTIVATNAITFAHATNGTASVHKSQVCWFTAGGAGPYTLTLPAWRTNMAQTVCVAITNGVVTKMVVDSIGTCADAATQTNCYVSFEYFK
jgi:hypothetical protein